MEGILNKIKGQPAAIDCTPEGMCTFDIQDFFVTLVAPCQTASCVVPGYSFVQGALAWLAGWGGMGSDRTRSGRSWPAGFEAIDLRQAQLCSKAQGHTAAACLSW